MSIFFVIRFHFSKCIYSKIRTRFRLGHYLRGSGSKGQVLLSHLLRQFFALPLLRPEDMKPEMTRLEAELKDLTKNHCTADDRKAFNQLFNYIVKTWMIGHGPDEISVFQARHKTNNVTER